MRNNTRHREKAPRPPAFTLIELLVVISIIVLLVTILLPAFGRVKEAMYKAKSQARIAELNTGANHYAQDNKYLYPGQADPTQLTGNTPAGPYTGSQVLASCLFKINLADGNNSQGIGFYAPLDPQEDLFDPGGNRRFSIWDRFPRNSKMVILYYPSYQGKSGLAQFVEADNAAYTSSSNCGAAFSTFITDSRQTGTVPFNSGACLLDGAGADGNYRTTDDVRNFGS